MAIRLEKGQRINLEKDNGSKLSQFCVGCNWGAIEKWVVKSCGFLGLSKKEVREVVDVDLDLSCLMFDAEGKPIDHIWSPLFRFGDRNVGLPMVSWTHLTEPCITQAMILPETKMAMTALITR